MLNPASRFEENAEAPCALLRPLAIFLVIAFALAVTSRQPVQAASREHASRHVPSAKEQPQPVRAMRSHATISHKVRARSAKAATVARHEQAAGRVVRSRGRRRAASAGRRSVALRNVRAGSSSAESVAASRPGEAPMARPVAGASSLVEAASTGVYAGGEPHPAGDDRISTAPRNDAAEYNRVAFRE